ncbi:HAAS signaling domain-containing protein [Cohnella nanjingensis]|uniref:DUF1700 domain-containing protein n=1 Tax=Cohnella nanjingensis TaxID=1387779 RepID=A0A7X0RM52_9BACL|nr:DUF1700 domain-containing protein [Cohnella nanjingensis]MBB6669891.1 DUF1700 domain-containing protein [Cohnella nanjingensis]
MNKKQFLGSLRHYLEPMPEPERDRMLQDIDAYFLSGEQIGKSEEQIAYELGDPMRIAAQALGFSYPPAPPQPPVERDVPRMLGVAILLFFLNLIMLPIGASLWSALLGVAAATVGLLLSPGAVLLEWVLNAHYSPAFLFVTMAALGVGLLMVFVTYYAAKLWIWLTAVYLRWNVNMWRGRTYS